VPAPVPTVNSSKDNNEQVTRSSIDTVKGPADWFTGDVYIDAVAGAPAPSRLSANLVHFMPGARTHWHRHPLSQTLFVTEGVGLCQRRAARSMSSAPATAFCSRPTKSTGTASAPNRLMVHVAINEADAEHAVVHWLTRVTDEDYAVAPAVS